MTVPPEDDAHCMSTLLRHLGIQAALMRYSLIHEMQFKVNFLLWIVVEALWFGLQLAFMGVLYGHTDQIAGWTRWEVVLLVGCNQFIQQLFHTSSSRTSRSEEHTSTPVTL